MIMTLHSAWDRFRGRFWKKEALTAIAAEKEDGVESASLEEELNPGQVEADEEVVDGQGEAISEEEAGSEEESDAEEESEPETDPGTDREDDPHAGEETGHETHRQKTILLSLPAEFRYLDDLIRYRMDLAFDPGSNKAEPPMPSYQEWDLPIGKYLMEYNKANTPWTPDEARLMLIALVHHVQPDLFDHSIDSTLKGGGDFPRIGGARGKNFRGFMPTGETALFLLAGDHWKRRLEVQQLFWADHPFATKKILWLEDIAPGEPAMSGKIVLSNDYVDSFTHSRVMSPHFSMSFPARLITTNRERSQLVINPQLDGQIEDLLDWIKFKEEVINGAEDGKFRKGYRSLFYGPSGTGKTFAAKILGKETGKEVYRIDLSMIVSKYIGETEKNLEVLFARAENKQWILFFDEADALFGKRTNIRDAHDKYANQEVSYLLQRIEDYDGLVILATNMRNNIDEAFIRRFNSLLKFPMPDAEERKKIWQNIFPSNVQFREKLPAVSAQGKPADAAAVNGSISDAADVIGLSGEKKVGRRPERPARHFYRYASVGDPAVVEAGAGPAGAGTMAQGAPDVPELVKKYVLSGGNIENIVHYASIKGKKRQSEGNEERKAPVIYLPDVIEGIRRELGKDGIPFVENKKTPSWGSQQQD
jgi:hypothetical protein